MSQRRFALAIALATAWGAVWALILQCTEFGSWLAERRTWATVVIGVGVDGAICALVTPITVWWKLAAIVAASSIGIIARAWINEHAEDSAQ